MDIHIQGIRLYGKMQHGERIFVLHHKWLVCLLYGFGNDVAPDITPIDEIIFIVAVGAGDYGLSDESGHLHVRLPEVHCQKIGCDFPAEHGID